MFSLKIHSFVSRFQNSVSFRNGFRKTVLKAGFSTKSKVAFPKNFLRAVIFVFVLSSAGLYAQEAEKNNYLAFGLGGFFPIDKIGIEYGIPPGPSVQISWYNPVLFYDFMGLGVHLDIGMPFRVEEDGLKGGAVVSSIIAGPIFTVFNNGTFTIPITAGFHFNYAVIFSKETNHCINLGLGAVSDFVWNFSKKWQAFLRLNMAINFPGGFEFFLAPALGMSFRF